MAEEEDDYDSNDFSYQACYVYKLADAPDHEIDIRPRKKRKTVPESVTIEKPKSTDTWPKLCRGGESELSAQLRQDAYLQHWHAALERIAPVAVEDVDDPTIQKIQDFFQAEETSDEVLRTAIIVSGPNKGAFGHCMESLRDDDLQDLVVQLRASQSPSLQAALKALIRNTIEAHASLEAYDSFVATHKRRIPMNFDLALLQEYVEEHDIPRIVVAMSDAETFDLSVFSEIVTNLLSWKGRLPIVLVLGLATTAHLFESRLSKATMRRLDTEVFTLSSDRDVFFDIVRAVQSPDTDTMSNVGLSLLLGPSIVGSLASLAGDQSTTLASFEKAIKYAYMTHFFSNPLATLLSERSHHPGQHDQALCEAIRNSPSFQAYCTAILDGTIPEWGANDVRQMLSSDTTLLDFVHDSLPTTFDSILLTNTLLLAASHLAALLSPTSSAISLYHDLMTCQLRNEILESDAYDIIKTQLPSVSTSTFTSITSKLSAPFPLESTTSPTALLAYVTMTLPDLSSRESPRLLSEALLATSRGPLVSAFNPKPRFAIERALASPADYLGCECCTSMRTTEPAAVLYRLLGEAGREINVMDLWMTFRDRLLDGTSGVNAKGKATKGKAKEKTPAKPKAGANRKGKGKEQQISDDDTVVEASTEDKPRDTDTEAAPEPERVALAHFHTALAEFRYLGLVKSTSDRRLNKGVEVISRTTWHGL
jgi:origin recognition complex subunit 3